MKSQNQIKKSKRKEKNFRESWMHMGQGRIVIITGCPGTGKTTAASIAAKTSDLEKSVHMHTDDFYHYLSKGALSSSAGN